MNWKEEKCTVKTDGMQHVGQNHKVDKYHLHFLLNIKSKTKIYLSQAELSLQFSYQLTETRTWSVVKVVHVGSSPVLWMFWPCYESKV